MSQLHKRFTSDQVKSSLNAICRMRSNKTPPRSLELKKKVFCLVDSIEKISPFHHPIHRASPPRISEALEKHLLFELSIEKDIIQNKDVPLTSYNYSLHQRSFEEDLSSKSIPHHHHPSSQKHGSFSRNPKGALMIERS